MRNIKLTLLIQVFFLFISCKKDDSPQKQVESEPTPRYSFALAFDDERSKLILFGGFNSGTLMNDTWEWDGTKWEMKSKSGPSPRNGPAMVYDTKRKKTILFGGDAGSESLSDTWEWDGDEWKLLSSEGPPGRSLHTLDYDAARDKIILFGGINSQITMGDLWEWDGVKWAQVVTTGGPDARFLHASSYDDQNKQILIFGGNNLLASTQQSFRGDLWSWDGSQWKQYTSTVAPSPRDHVDMVYDQLKKKTIVHGGGVPGGASASDTREWDGNTWSIRIANSPSPTEGYKLVYDSKNETVLLFGGFVGGSPTSSIWELNTDTWSLLK